MEKRNKTPCGPSWLGKGIKIVAGISGVLGLLLGPQAIAQYQDRQAAEKATERAQYAQIQAPSVPRPRATPIPESLVPPTPDSEADSAQMKMGGSHNCWCDVTCKSDQTGLEESSRVALGSGFSWPITAAKHDQCEARCQAHLETKARDTKLCKTGNCRSVSEIGTGIGGSRDQGPVSFNNTASCAIPPTPSLAAACCAPFSGTQIAELFAFNAMGNVTNNYGLTYLPNAAFDARMNAFASYAGTVQAGCNPSKITYELVNKGTGAVISTMTATYTGSGSPTFAPALSAGNKWAAVNLPPNQAEYTVRASGGCRGFTSDNCAPRGFHQVVGVSTFRMIPGATAPNNKAAF